MWEGRMTWPAPARDDPVCHVPWAMGQAVCRVTETLLPRGHLNTRGLAPPPADADLCSSAGNQAALAWHHPPTLPPCRVQVSPEAQPWSSLSPWNCEKLGFIKR